MFTPIASSDFNVAVYAPWVVNSLPVSSPSGKVTYNRNVKDQDAGGLNIRFTYTPTGAKDPKTINFLQAYNITTPGLNGGKPVYAFDSGVGATTPYYNEKGASGVGTGDTNGVPLGPIADKSNAWLLDTPYICEAGFNGGSGCPAPGKNEELFSSYVDTFDVFIEANQTVKGTNYQVLYGGFEWGFTFTATDAPEASTWAMMLLGLAGLAVPAARRGRRPALGVGSA